MIDIVKILLITFSVLMILFIGAIIINTKTPPAVLGFYLFMLVLFSYQLGHFIGKNGEMERCYHEKKALMDSELTYLKTFNKRTESLLKDLLYEYKGKKYVLLENVELKPTTNGNNRGWVEGVVYAPIDGEFKIYVREKNEFFDRFKKIQKDGK